MLEKWPATHLPEKSYSIYIDSLKFPVSSLVAVSSLGVLPQIRGFNLRICGNKKQELMAWYL
jgi:hypothetical protein